MLPVDLTKIIFSYLSVTTLQLLNDSGYIINITNLIKIDNNTILTPFEQYCRLKMLNGQIGYNGQWYLPVYACLFYSIKNDNLNLFNYYIIRYFDNDLDKTLKVIGWIYRYQTFVNIIRYLINNTANPEDFNKILDSFSFLKTTIMSYISCPYLSTDKLTEVLVTLDHFSLSKYTNQDFPFIEIVDIYYVLANKGVITKDVIKQIELMVAKVQKLFAVSINRDRYIDIISVLLNKDINVDILNKFNTDSIKLLMALAKSVLNSKVINTINNSNITNANKSYINNFAIKDIIISEIIYDTKVDINMIISPTDNKLIVSIYLSNNALLFIDQLSPIDVLYNDIVNYEATKKQIIRLSTPKIYDAETGLRLSNLVNVKPFLYPATDFDKQLMQQFGLL